MQKFVKSWAETLFISRSKDSSYVLCYGLTDSIEMIIKITEVFFDFGHLKS